MLTAGAIFMRDTRCGGHGLKESQERKYGAEFSFHYFKRSLLCLWENYEIPERNADKTSKLFLVENLQNVAIGISLGVPEIFGQSKL